MDARKKFGADGESLTADYLEKQGYRILERNFRCALGEIDLIASEKGQIVFVEVKTRHSDAFVSPKTAVNAGKQRKIARTAVFYLKGKGMLDKSSRFDVVTLVDGNGEKKFELIRNAFLLPTG